ncbi:MAG TPA: ABC transporter permease [Saprospiraceae bacterium]|nr:ABC transporter permease [Saprospiraceae bacterium]
MKNEVSLPVPGAYPIIYRLQRMIEFIKQLFRTRYVLRVLIFRDFQSRYLASYLGLPWAFIQPLIYVIVIWFAFTFGLRAGAREDGTAFVPWLLAGLIPWMFMSQTIFHSCNSLGEYSYLIKKTKFNVAFIPLIKIFSGMIIHCVLIFISLCLFVFKFGITPSIYWIQLLYYFFAMFILLAGIGWFVASVNVFIKDIVHLVNIIVSIFFWATPILWSYSMLEGNLKYIALLNPFFYITEGYRYTFLENRWFFEFPEMNIYFWGVTLVLLFLGIYTFQKLKPDFGDEL